MRQLIFPTAFAYDRVFCGLPVTCVYYASEHQAGQRHLSKGDHKYDLAK
jgi:hypothetical protein